MKAGWKEMDGVLYYEDRPYLPKIIKTKIISRDYHDPLAGHFGVEKTIQLIARKYYWPSLQADIKAYV